MSAMSSHPHPPKRRAVYRLLSLLLPERITRRKLPGAPPIDSPSRSRAIRHLDACNVLHVRRASSCANRHVTINILPDDVLLHVFFFDELVYRYEGDWSLAHKMGDVDRQFRLPWKWHRLAHVYRRWRSIIFASPNFLDLRLVCHPGTRMELARIWPPLPIIITNAFGRPNLRTRDFDFDAVIVYPNRVREINLLSLTRPQLQRLATQMQEHFPALIHLSLGWKSGGLSALALPDGFLGGSAPQLQSLSLNSIPFPALSKFLLSATDLPRLPLP